MMKQVSIVFDHYCLRNTELCKCNIIHTHCDFFLFSKLKIHLKGEKSVIVWFQVFISNTNILFTNYMVWFSLVGFYGISTIGGY